LGPILGPFRVPIFLPSFSFGGREIKFGGAPKVWGGPWKSSPPLSHLWKGRRLIFLLEKTLFKGGEVLSKKNFFSPKKTLPLLRSWRFFPHTGEDARNSAGFFRTL